MTTEEKLENFIETQRATMFGDEIAELRADEMRLNQTLRTENSLGYHIKFVIIAAIMTIIIYALVNHPMSRLEQCQSMHVESSAEVEYVWSFDRGCEAREVAN